MAFLYKLKNRPLLSLMILGLFFSGIYSFLYYDNQSFYHSPDENATAVFVEHYLGTRGLSIDFDQNPGYQIRPRSVNVYDNHFVPGSFIGLILFLSSFGLLLSESFIRFIPAVFAGFSPLFLFVLFRKFFSERIAYLAAILCFFIPTWWHFANKGFLPNSLFLSLLLMAFGIWVLACEDYLSRYRIHLGIISGIAFGWAFLIRPVELWWVLGIVLIYSYYQRKSFNYLAAIGVVIGFFFPLVYGLFIQQQTFGAWYRFGYQQLADIGNDVDQTSSILSVLWTSLFPFGLSLKSLMRFWLHQFGLFWWQWGIALFGLILHLKSIRTSLNKYYLGVFIFISLYLIFYYGSWDVADHLSGEVASIGHSYQRYWLPISLFSLPYIAIALDTLGSKLKKLSRIPFLIFISIAILTVFFVGNESLLSLKSVTNENYSMIKDLSSSIEENAIIMSKRSDKLFWPQNNVIHIQDSIDEISHLDQMSELYPLYWFSLLPPDQMNEVNETVLYEKKVVASFITQANSIHWLYVIKPR